MPKEFFEFDLSKPPGASWGLRIGGGVDRGKVIVIEKVRFFLIYLLHFYIKSIYQINEIETHGIKISNVQWVNQLHSTAGIKTKMKTKELNQFTVEWIYTFEFVEKL